MQLKIITNLLAILMLFACNQPTEKKAPDFLAVNTDSTVSPASDFFQYANGGWIKNNPIPKSESGWGVASLVQQDIFLRLRTINEKAVDSKPAVGTIEQKIGDFWYSGMDSTEIEKQGLHPLKNDLEKINRIASIRDIIDLTADFHKKDIDALFSFYIGQDDKNSDKMALLLLQGGLGMPNREYYFNTDPRTIGVKKAYQDYLVRTFMQLGNDSTIAAANAKTVYDLETRLAKASRKVADLRDPYKNYNKMSIGELQKLSGNLNWPSYLQQTGMIILDSVIVGQPEFYSTLSNELKATPIDTWKKYLQVRLIQSSAPYLDDKTYMSFFEFRKSLTGASEPRSRWKRVLIAEEDAMGEALGQLFVKEYFNGKAKERYVKLVEDIRDAYKERIMKLSWMSDSTKQKALAKLSSITKKVGYPDKWKDFSSLQIDRGPYVLNIQKANLFWHNYEVNKLGKPVDKSEWGMSPQTYDAYYNPSNNEIVLPAGIFTVPGKRDEELDDAFVYGYSAASTIGHEITHGFDDQGRQYDDKGNLRNWWQGSDETQFRERAKKIVQQYNEFIPVDTLHINGEATQGENIADLGGMILGLDAYKKTDSYKSGTVIGGFTPLQRFFLGYAYAWLYEVRKESLARQVITDVHSPAKERVNGPVANVPEFYEAFGVKKGDKMYREDSLRVRIW